MTRINDNLLMQYIDHVDPAQDTIVLRDESAGTEAEFSIDDAPALLAALNAGALSGADVITWAGIVDIPRSAFAGVAYALGGFSYQSHLRRLGPNR